MCFCGWQLVAATVVLQLLIIAYGEIEGRRRQRAPASPRTVRPPAPPRKPRDLT